MRKSRLSLYPIITPLYIVRFLFFIYSNNDRFPVIHKSFSSEFIDFISRNELIWFNYMHMYTYSGHWCATKIFTRRWLWCFLASADSSVTGFSATSKTGLPIITLLYHMPFALTVVVIKLLITTTTLAWGGDQLSLFTCWLRACLPSQRPLLRLSVFGWRVALVSVSPFQPSWEHLLSWVLYIQIRKEFFSFNVTAIEYYILFDACFQKLLNWWVHPGGLTLHYSPTWFTRSPSACWV